MRRGTEFPEGFPACFDKVAPIPPNLTSLKIAKCGFTYGSSSHTKHRLAAERMVSAFLTVGLPVDCLAQTVFQALKEWQCKEGLS